MLSSPSLKTKIEMHQKQVAVILPKWVVHHLLDMLDAHHADLFHQQQSSIDVLNQEEFDDLEEELNFYERAIVQIDGQLNS